MYNNFKLASQNPLSSLNSGQRSYQTHTQHIHHSQPAAVTPAVVSKPQPTISNHPLMASRLVFSIIVSCRKPWYKMSIKSFSKSRNLNMYMKWILALYDVNINIFIWAIDYKDKQYILHIGFAIKCVVNIKLTFSPQLSLWYLSMYVFGNFSEQVLHGKI